MTIKTQIEKAWNNAKPIRGKNPDTHRQDPYGNIMYKESYGKNSKMGWAIDHIKPKLKGGNDTTRNLQALNSIVNKSKGASLVKKSRHSQGNQ